MYGDKEITLLTENVPTENHSVKFTLKPLGNTYIFTGNNCEYEMTTMSPVIHEIYGNYDGGEYYYTISHQNNDPNYRIYHGLLEIKVEFIEDLDNPTNPETFWTQYFYWDVADCNYYSTIPDAYEPCSSGGPGDILLKYNAQGNQIFFFWGNDPDPNGWKDVSGLTKRYIDYAFPGTIPCPLTATPTGLNVTGNVGGHPTITWNPNTETGLGGYYLYQSIDGATYTLLVTLDEQTTSYTDNGVIIGDGKFDPLVCYRLSSFGRSDVESPMTFPPRCIMYSGLNKEGTNSDARIVYKNILFNAYPNPFNPSTVIPFQVKENSFVKVKIYDMLGREIETIVNKYIGKGIHRVSFDASNLASGSYIYSLEVNDFFQTKIFNVIK